jgi:hypothetical protein
MPCVPVRGTTSDGHKWSGFVCTRGQKVKPCAVCGNPSTKLCDGDIGNGKTCDVPLCSKCALHICPDKDYCPKHRPAGNHEDCLGCDLTCDFSTTKECRS